MSALHLPHAVYQAIRAHGERTYPHECCGALLGVKAEDGWRVEASIEAGNTRTDSAHNRYQIAPLELMKIERTARQRGLAIAGFYHSHPDHPAQWSQTDFNEAHWIGCSYVITAVEKGKAAQTNSFALMGSSEETKRFEPEPIAVAG
jgi:proteasome lid subunit RPN8/RPN11